jgi:predicted enzyme related to lactoylglutathione lyase
MTHPVVGWEIRGRDVERLRRFYEDLFGWKVDMARCDRGIVEVDGGVPGAIVKSDPGVVIQVRVSSLLAALARVAEFGGTAVTDPEPDKGRGSVAEVRDPQGNLIELLRLDERRVGEDNS